MVNNVFRDLLQGLLSRISIVILQQLFALAATAILTAIIVSWGWLISRLLTGRRVLPDHPLIARRPVSWHFGTIFLVFLAYVVVSSVILGGYGLIAGRSPVKSAESVTHGETAKVPAVTVKNEPPPRPGPADVAAIKNVPATPVNPDDEKSVPWFLMLSLNAVIQVVLLLLVPLIVRLASGARLRDVGLSFPGWTRQATFGVIATLIAIPPVYAIQFVAVQIWKPQQHPLTLMIAKDFSVVTCALAVLTAVILAPMFEELVFRGLLQNWLVVLLNRRSRVRPVPLTVDSGVQTPIEDIGPAEVAQADLNLPGMAQLGESIDTSCPKSSPKRAYFAIFLTSLLFAYVHAPQWPAPIALFLLAVVIGTVYYRTGSLLTAIFMHATFNGLSTFMMFMAMLSGDKPPAVKVAAYVTAEQHESFEMFERTFTVSFRPDSS